MGRPAEASGPARRTWNRTPVGSQRSSATVGRHLALTRLNFQLNGLEDPTLLEGDLLQRTDLHVAELSALGDPVTIRIRLHRQVVRLLTRAGFEVLRYRKHGFTQGHLPWFGRYCNPALFECRVAGRT